MMIAGAMTNTGLSANGGTQSSLVSSLIVSATVCRMPNGPTRFGPYRSCHSASIRRSSQTRPAADPERRGRDAGDDQDHLQGEAHGFPHRPDLAAGREIEAEGAGRRHGDAGRAEADVGRDPRGQRQGFALDLELDPVPGSDAEHDRVVGMKEKDRLQDGMRRQPGARTLSSSDPKI